MKTRDLTFTQLLEILQAAEAIQFDGTLVCTLVYPQVNVYDEPCFEVSLDDESLLIYSDDVSDLHINDYGNIEFEMNGDIYMISVLERKELA